MTSIARLGRWLVPQGRPLRWALPVAVLAALLVVQWQVPDWLALPEAWALDARFRLRGAESVQNDIVVVALDEDSFQILGDLEGENIHAWSRGRWAELVSRIAAGEPRVIILDVIFDTPGWDEGGDAALARAMAEAGNVVLASHFDGVEEAVYRRVVYSEPIAVLAEAAAGVGVSSMPLDVDGAIRRAALVTRWGDQDRPSLPLLVTTLVTGRRVNVERVDLGADLSLPIHYRGPEGTFETVPAYGVMLDDEGVDGALFRDAIVLVGFTTQLEQDRHAVPFGMLPGVEIQANALDTFLAADWYHRSPAWLAVVLVAGMGILALAALNLRRVALGGVLLLGGIVAYGVANTLLFVGADSVLPAVAPVVAGVLVGGVVLAERLVFAERDKRKLRQRFAGVMSPERMGAVLANWETLLDADRPLKEAAILFSDVRGFTSATEAMMEQGRVAEMVHFITAYLDAMSDAVFAEGGVIYDVVGDGLMILFGIPEPFPDYALRATRAAVRMAMATEDLQSIWPLRDQRPLGMGIGLHCGEVIDAVVGRKRQIDYAVIGDPVNTAARIEAHCKVAMEVPRPPGGTVPETVTILLSGDVYEKVRGHVLVDESVPPFEARGKSGSLRVVRLLGLEKGLAH